MTRTPALLRPYKICQMSMDGCRSACSPEGCDAAAAGHCRGCNECDFGDPQGRCPEGGCDKCWTRCWRREDIDLWMQDIEGLDFDTHKCSLPFTGELPGCVPQIRDNVWDVYHPAYVIPVRKIMNPKTGRLIFRKKGLRTHWRIPKESKLILSFCARDDVIEDIWTRQFHKWDKSGRNFWQVLGDYGFDAALSVDYSCFNNYPRMDHLISMKRNVITSSRLAEVGIPVILDVMIYCDEDLDRLVRWGKDQGFIWYNLNFQMTKKVDWVLDLVCERCDKILSIVPDAKIMIMGVGDAERVGIMQNKYPGKIAMSTSNVLMHSQYRRVYSEKDHKWVRLAVSPKEAFERNLEIFNHASELASK